MFHLTQKSTLISKHQEIVSLIIIYLLSFAVVYINLSLPARVFIFLILLAYQLTSFKRATIVLLLVLFVPFYSDLFKAVGIPFITPARVLFIPYIYHALKTKKIRHMPVNGHLLFIIIVSIFTLKISSDIYYSIMDVPGDHASSKGFKNIITGYYSIYIRLSFIYFTFTRLDIEYVKELFVFLLLLVFLESLGLLYFVLKRPEVIFDFASQFHTEGYHSYLWNNRLFGNKNDWGMLFSFAIIIITAMMSLEKEKKLFYNVLIIIIIAGLAISISRQAYVWTALGVLVVGFGTKNSKMILGFLVLVFVLFSLKPDFIFARMEMMLTAESTSDIKSFSRKVSDQAWEQAVSNFQLLPRMFFTNWEYNWSEGFWNGMLHQQGILGLVFHVYIYLFIFFRYGFMFKYPNKKLRVFCLIGMILAVLIFFANINRRTTHFLHYRGFITQLSFFNMFIYMYLELAYYAYKKRLKAFLHM